MIHHTFDGILMIHWPLFGRGYANDVAFCARPNPPVQSLTKHAELAMASALRSGTVACMPNAWNLGYCSYLETRLGYSRAKTKNIHLITQSNPSVMVGSWKPDWLPL